MTRLKRVLPYPLLFVALLGMWLLMTQSLSTGQFLLGALVAFGGCWTMVALDPPAGRLRRPGAVARLAGRVFIDVFRSNLAVGSIILGSEDRRTHAGFMSLRLDLTSPYGLAVLAIILTCTPGTQWVRYDPSQRVLMLHVLDLVDDRHWVRTIKERYESLLMEIFE
ncbi:multisubunit potassium/proton antiporter PhaE subunit [Ancylobacter aquaticus]|uniref:Multisubunit potassium/proton antiporter PhaE subunit n=1 Tax=Ancylobacter aquaticus TaxID=100 RepID=A0A4R1I5X9_ANCAQ|nr:Na+/H+ antiporter subunit E [Ancylobacter aquaticus]TCK28870.1 multisubunit potassium/proton antiporter PhaE subunit [Ancylobacter aquaticus]